MTRTACGFLIVSLGAATASAQDPSARDPRIVVREVVRDVVRTPRASVVRYQGRDRGPEQTERFSKRVKLGRDGRFTIENIAGFITVTGGSGDEVSIEAVKRTRGPAEQLGTVHILVEERAGRVDVRTEHTARNDRVAVDYTVTVPASARVEAKSVSGDLKVSSIQGAVRGETISGSVTVGASPKVEMVKSVSGDVELSDASADAELSATNISGRIRAHGVKVRTLELGTVSGDIILSDVACERVGARSVSGSVEYGGTLATRGRYEFNVHSGNIRLTLGGNTGFDLNADTFSGQIRSDLPLTLGATNARNERGRFGPGRSLRGVFGDGSAALTIRTFSGDVVITKK